MAVRWGIISTGRHPAGKIVPAMQQASGTELRAVCSRTIERARRFAAENGIPQSYDSVDSLLADPAVDAVFIASPNFLHADQTIRAARRGKHVLVEKPMAVTAAEAQAMVRAAEEYRVRLGVGFHLRHHPGHVRARELIARGALGTLSMIQGQWCFGERTVAWPPDKTGPSAWWNDPEMMGGASTLMGTGVHVIDLLYYLTGAPIVEVAAITDGQTRERPLEQAAAVSVRFGDGTLGTICVGRRMPDSENDVMVYGSHGRIALRDTLWEACGGRLEAASETENFTASYENDRHRLYLNEIEAFNRAIETGEPFQATGWDGLHSVNVLSAILSSAAGGRIVRVAHATRP